MKLSLNEELRPAGPSDFTASDWLKCLLTAQEPPSATGSDVISDTDTQRSNWERGAFTSKSHASAFILFKQRNILGVFMDQKYGDLKLVGQPGS